MNDAPQTTVPQTHEQAHDILPARLAVKAMRDSGYKNAAYALAELMDNAIQAGASEVELLCGERTEFVNERQRSRIHRIAVLDDGRGMDARVLRMALQFGNGTRLTPDEQTGIGKFGMGLPNSSISQCRRVDVWSWQNGPAEALHTYIDIDEIMAGRQGQVPAPDPRPLPSVWRQAGQSFSESGTLVVWSNLDRVIWKTARAIIRNSERLIGRMYRKFLDEGQTRIRLCAFDFDRPSAAPAQDDQARPNDPMHLMADTICPEPFSGRPMFEQWGKPLSAQIADRDGTEHEVRVTFSCASEEAREGYNPGAKPHGKHAKKNMGVSIVRAGRELELDDSWTGGYDPVDRWWGVEVEFPPALDDVFGVANNKQTAHNFHRIDIDVLKEGEETKQELLDRLEDEEHPSGPILDVSDRITRGVSTLKRLLDNQTKGKRKKKQRHEEAQDEQDPAERHATEQTKKRQQEGHRGKSDEGESQPEETRKQEIADELKETGYSEVDATERADAAVKGDRKYQFVKADLDSMDFFSIKSRGGTLLIKLNTGHPAYGNLVEVLEEPADEADAAELRERLQRARDGLRLLLMAWARYEDEHGYEAQDARYDWGSIAHRFLQGSV